MGRRVTTLLLLAATLLSQWAGAGRCLGGCGAGGPDRRPHVHLDALLPGQSDKPADECSCRRHANLARAGGFEGRPVGPGVGDAPSDEAPGHKPGRGVLYLSPDAGVSLPTAGGDRVGGDPAVLPDTFEPAVRPSLGFAAGWCLSSSPRPSRPLYLLTCSLLI